MAITDPISFFAQTLIPSVPGGTARRVPFTFTSTKRLLAAGGVAKATSSRELAKAEAEEVLKDELKRIDGQSTLNTVVGSLGLSQFSSLNVQPIVSMMVNPSSVRWSQPKRFTKRDTMTGSVFFHFSDTNGSNNDILTLTFSGNTGNIDTQGEVNYNAPTDTGPAASTVTGAPNKLRTWHELYALTREPVLLDGGVKNEFFITYRTVLFPTPITFIGFYNTTLDFTESAEKPYSRDYTFSFTVTNTSPDLNTLCDKINSSLAVLGDISAVRSITG
jgi:hypothetical protein